MRALVITAAGIRRYLRWLGEPTEPPILAPARDPPFFKSAPSAAGSASPRRRSCSTRIERAVASARVRAGDATRRYRAPLERETPAPGAYRASPANTPPPSGPASRAPPGRCGGVHVTYAPALARYPFLPAARADLLEQLGRYAEAQSEFERAAALADNTRQRERLHERARGCRHKAK